MEDTAKDYKEDTASSMEHIGLELSDTILHSEAAHKERRFRHSFSLKHSPATQVYGLAGRRHCHHHPRKEEIIRLSAYRRFQSRYRITNFHHHAPLPFNSKRITINIDLPYLATLVLTEEKKCINGRSHATIYSVMVFFRFYFIPKCLDMQQYSFVFLSSSFDYIFFPSLFAFSSCPHSSLTIHALTYYSPHFHARFLLIYSLSDAIPIYPLSNHEESQCSDCPNVRMIKTWPYSQPSRFMICSRTYTSLLSSACFSFYLPQT